MDRLPNYQLHYQQLLNNPNLESLSNFRVRAPKQVFISTNDYPQFFNSNLLSGGRVIKILRGDNAVVRGFYYQLMKICFQIEIQGKNYLEMFKEKVFDPKLKELNSSPTSGQLYSNIQYKKFVAQFIQTLINQSIPNFQLTINEYPIIDESLNHIFHILIHKHKHQMNKLSTQQKLQLLSQMFQIDCVPYGKCYKFQQSDVFIYEEGQQQFYMAFLNEMGEVSQTDTSQLEKGDSMSQNQRQEQYSRNQETEKYDLTLEENKIENSKVLRSGSEEKSKYNQSLINMVQDLSKYSKDKTQNQKQSEDEKLDENREKYNEINQISQKFKNIEIHTQKDSQRRHHKVGQFDKNISEVQSFNLHHSPYNSLATQEQSISKRQSNHIAHQTLTQPITQQPNNNKFYRTNPLNHHTEINIPHRNIPTQSKYIHVQQDLIYRPKKLNTITQLSSLKQYSQSNPINHHDYRNQYDNRNKYHQLDKDDSDSKGTFYKQFTNTKILQFVKEPHRTKIKLIKDRFKGVRSKKIRNG